MGCKGSVFAGKGKEISRFDSVAESLGMALGLLTGHWPINSMDPRPQGALFQQLRQNGR